MGCRMIQIRPATRADVDELVPDTYGKTVRAVVAEKDGRLIGIGGVIHTTPLQWFGHVSDELRSHPKSLLKAAKIMRDMVESYDVPVYATTDDDVEASGRFLEHLGFHKMEDEEIYRWPQPYLF